MQDCIQLNQYKLKSEIGKVSVYILGSTWNTRRNIDLLLSESEKDGCQYHLQDECTENMVGRCVLTAKISPTRWITNTGYSSIV